VKKSGGLEYTEKIMLNFRNEAISILASMPAGEANQSLLKLIDYTIDRTI
jgi:octaprenyl-diphosphate synthase